MGSLLYCAVDARTDDAYAEGMLCHAMGKLTSALYASAIGHVLYYLKYHAKVGLRYST